ncbi:hypothetical protein BJY52DRAFT_1213488 [Lactarius psammicola]|nr:hypothetical protein BJY52DRAFT_1213488 [Lactarius psammicola]
MTKKLTAGSVQELASFTKADRKGREIRAFALALEIRDLLSHVEGNWAPTEDALTNIKEFSIACLLSTSSPSYKFGSTAIVLDTLRKVSIGLPEGWYNNPARRGTVSSAVTKYLTLARSDMKKMIRASMGTDENPDNKQNIAELADKIMGLGGANTYATVKHWARFAVMRSVYLTFNGQSFWDQVDEKLKSIREKADTNHPENPMEAKKDIHTELNYFLQVDFTMWGNPIDSGRRAAHEAEVCLNPVQQSIDRVAAANAGYDVDQDVNHRRTNGRACRKRRRVNQAE